MRPLRRLRRISHHVPHQLRTNRRCVRRNFLRQLQAPLHRRLGRIAELREQIPHQRVVGRVHGARGREMRGLAQPDQPRQEPVRDGLHDDAATAEDEACLGLGVADADGGGEGHGHADADGGAVQGDDGGFRAAEDC